MVRKPKAQTSRFRFQTVFGKPIEDYESIKRATSTLNKVTKANYYRVLPEYFLFLKMNPDQVLEQRKQDLASSNYEDTESLERKTIEYLRTLIDVKGYTGRGVNGVKSRIGGFYANNSKRFAIDLRKLKVSKARKYAKYSPTNEEVRHLYGLADCSRDRLIIALMYQNGLCPVDLSLLEVGDLPLEPWMYYEKSRSKTGEMWRSATTPDISFELKHYLKIRETQPNSSLTKTLLIGREGPLDNQAISNLMFLLIKKSGLNTQNGFKPTALRDAFEDALVEANVNHKVKESLMGHSGSIENEYGGHRNLMVNTVEALKKTYPLMTLNGHSQEGLAVKAEFELRIVKLDETMASLVSEQKRRRIEDDLKNAGLEALLKRVLELEKKLGEKRDD
jgi:integrase